MSNNQRTIRGDWWIPKFEESTIQGILHLNPDGQSNLELFFPKNISSQDWLQENGIEIVFGESINGEAITLINCRIVNFEGFIRVHQVSYVIETIFIGAIIQNPETKFIDSVNIAFTHLNEWVQIPTFELESIENKIIATRNFAEFSTKYKDFVISLLVSSISSHQPSIEYTLKKTCAFQITVKTKKSLLELQNVISYLQNFLSLAYTFRAFLTDLYFYDDNNKRVDIHLNTFRLADEHIYPIYPTSLFSFYNIKNSFSSNLQKWFAFEEEYSPITNLYISVLNNRYYYAESIYLHLIQILETYHRRKYKNKIYLKDRIVAILDDLTERGIYLQSIEIDKDGFSERVKNTRNYYTHYDKSPEKRIISQGNLLIIDIQKLRGLIEIIFLLEIGFTTDFINNSRRIDQLLNGILL